MGYFYESLQVIAVAENESKCTLNGRPLCGQPTVIESDDILIVENTTIQFLGNDKLERREFSFDVDGSMVESCLALSTEHVKNYDRYYSGIVNLVPFFGRS